MSKPLERFVFVERLINEEITELKLNGQLDHIAHAAERNSQLKLSARVVKPEIKHEQVEKGHKYSAKIKVVKRQYRSLDAANRAINKGIEQMVKAAKTKGWRLLENEDDVTGEITQKDIKILEGTAFDLPVLNKTNRDLYFDTIYERDAHINCIYQSVKAAVSTNFRKRSHTLLYGKPACAKTSIFMAFKDFFESTQKDRNPEIPVIAILDGTTLTKAGLERWIIDNAKEGTLPNILCLEEIEKHQPENLLSLLSVMDNRAMLSRTNARDGRVIVNVPMLVWATCNNDEMLKNFHKGALWSRFQNRYECIRPSFDLMRKILKREIENMEGDEAWIEPALKLGYHDIPEWTNEEPDPRQCIAVLDGQERLLDGSYANDLAKIFGRKAATQPRNVQATLQQVLAGAN